jgi:hypothetical protein
VISWGRHVGTHPALLDQRPARFCAGYGGPLRRPSLNIHRAIE